MTLYHQIKDLFDAALDLAPDERSAFLAQACDGDAELRAEVEALLDHHRQSEGFLEQPVFALHPGADALSPGEHIGPYKILRQIGRGGMGEVYLAVRDDEQYRKQVAIKLIRSHAETSFIIDRFRRERQILAQLSHPYIVPLLDGGTTEGGSPYLVLEFVDGQPIDEYCDAHSLSTIARLQLFRQVCAAVHYAHQNLVVHRDIKPGNILVTEDGVPKLLDFGIAKLLAPTDGRDLDQTLTGLRLLTPDYASPEQINGQPITTSSDVYSLGVLLYELLSGHRPYRVTSLPPAEMAHVICEQDPVKPSAAAGRTEEIPSHDGAAERVTPETVSATREGEPDKLRRRLSGDLDTIVLMALRKDPARRYASVEHLSEDIRRHLEGLPVRARPDTLVYRSVKFIRRNRVATGAAFLIALALVIGALVATWQARIAGIERARAEKRFNDVRRLANSFLFEFHDGIEKLPGATPMRELLVRRALEYLDSLSREAGNDAGLQNELATAYDRIGNIQSSFGWANKGDTAGALASYRKALSIREAVAAASPEAAAVQLALAGALAKVGQNLIHTHDFPGATDHLRRAQSLLEPLIGRAPHEADARRQLLDVFRFLVQALSEQNQSEQAMNICRQALRLAEEESAQRPADRSARRETGLILYEMGYLVLGTKDNAESVALCRRALTIFKELAETAPRDPQARRDLALAHDQLGSALYEAKDLAGELENYRASLRLREELAAADPANEQSRSDLATGYYNLGYALVQNGETAAGIATYQKAVALIEAAAAANPANARLRGKVANFYLYFGKLWEMLATKERLPRAVQRRHWEAARSWYQRTLTLTDEMRAQNLATGAVASSPKQLAEHLDWCDAALAKLK